jgi:hypothetical protein
MNCRSPLRVASILVSPRRCLVMEASRTSGLSIFRALLHRNRSALIEELGQIAARSSSQTQRRFYEHCRFERCKSLRASRTIRLRAGWCRWTLPASDSEVEKAIRDALASPAIAQMPRWNVYSGRALKSHGPPANDVQVSASASPAVAPAQMPEALAHPASAGLSVKQMMEEHTRMMGEMQAAQVELLRSSLARQQCEELLGTTRRN